MSRPTHLVPAGIGLLLVACGPPAVTQVVGILEMSPTVLDFHNVCLGATGEFPVTLKNDGNGPLTIKSVTSSNPPFSGVVGDILRTCGRLHFHRRL